MADSNVPITAGSGTNIDTQTQPGGDHRQVVVVGDAVATNVTKVNTNGDLVASLSNPNSLAAGIYATLTPFGGLNVSTDPTGLLTDTFDTSVIDTNKWTTAGSVPPTQAAGTMSVNPGSGANATSTLASQYAFGGATTIMVAASIAFENGGPATGCVRFFGFGLPPSVPGTFAAPIQDGVGIEITTAGVMRGVVYSAGSVVASGGTSVLAMPTNGAIHKYAVLVRGDIAFVYQDNFDVPAATLTLKPSVETLPVRIACLNSASVPGFTPIMNVSGLAVLDWARNAQGIADGTYPWRKAKVGVGGDILETLTSPNAAALGIFGMMNPYGTQRVTVEPTPVFFDPFDGSTVDQTNRWSSGGNQTPSQSNGQVTLAPAVGVNVSNTSTLISQPTFLSPGIGFLVYGSTVTLEAAQVNAVNVNRFWGKGQVTSFAYTTPVTDGIGFEVEGTVGALQCVVYIGGTKYVVQSTNAALISSSVAGAGGSGTALPTGAVGSNYGAPLTWKGGQHRYAIFVRSDVIYWFVEGTEVPVAVLSYATPNVQATPVRIHSITNSAATSLANTFTIGAFAVADTTAQNHTLSDGTYAWRKLKVDSLGNVNTVVQGLSGTVAAVRPDSVFRAAIEPSPLLYDTFDTAIDVNRWATGGTVPPTSTAGVLTVQAGTAGLATSWLSSQAIMPLTINSYVTPNALITTDSIPKTGAYRFCGLGVQATSPTVSAPITNGVGFEWIDTTGSLSGVVWSNGVRTQSVSLLSGQPVDGATHRYLMYYKTSRVYFEIDGVQIGSISYPAPQVSNLPMLTLCVNGGSTVSPAAVFTATFLGVADSAHDNVFISDATYPSRKAKVTTAGEQRVSLGVPNIVQKKSGMVGGFVSTLPIAFNALNVAGGSIVVTCAIGNLTAPSVFDSNGNTYKLVLTQAGAAVATSIFIATNIVASTALNTVTVNNNGSLTSMAAEIYEVDALLSSSAGVVDASQGATATSTAPATGALSPTSPNELLFFAVGVGTAAQTISPAAGWTNDSGQLNPASPQVLFSFASFSQPAGSMASITPSATIVSEPWAAAAVAFRPTTLSISGAVRLTDGTNSTAVKPASTAAVATDTAVVVALHPTSPVPLPTLTKGTQAATGISTQDLKDSGRVAINWTLEFSPAAVAEALMTMTESRDGAAVTTYTTKVVTSGKRLRVQTWGMTCENTLGANPKRAKLRMKFNTGGAVTTASPLLANLVASVTGTVNTVGNEATQDFPDGLEFLGDGTKQIGFTLEFPDWVTAAQTGKVYVTIVAFEY